MPSVANQDVRDAEIWRAWVVDRRTMEDIGAELEISHQAVSKAIARHRARLGPDALDQARADDLARLEALIEAHWDKATETTSPEAALGAVIAIVKYRGKVLGYLAPARFDATVAAVTEPPPEPLTVTLDRIMASHGVLPRQVEPSSNGQAKP
jgi:hypothetical protein